MEHTTEPLVVVSSDTHIGPRLREQSVRTAPIAISATSTTSPNRSRRRARRCARALAASPRVARNQQTDGHHDVHARLRDLDYDGVAAEVIFHGSQNGEPIPFQSFGPFLGYEKGDNLELLGVGYHIYNQWLADFCSVEPERHVGLAHLPMWDIDAAVREAEWARASGPARRELPRAEAVHRAVQQSGMGAVLERVRGARAHVREPRRCGEPERGQRARLQRGDGVGAVGAEPRVADQPARLRRRVRASSRASARAHRAARHMVVVHAERARLDLSLEHQRVRPRARRAGAEASERLLPRAGVRRRKLPRALRGRGRGRQTATSRT